MTQLHDNREHVVRLIHLVAWLMVSACYDFGAGGPPSRYVEGVATDVYFIGEIPEGAATANVAFATAPLDRMPLPSDFSIPVVSFNRPGDNYFDDSLGLGELTDPVKGETRWLWGGPVPLPYPRDSTSDFVGVKIRSLPYEAIAGVPGTHNYCLVEGMGVGVRECASWIDAILQLLVLCRGAVGQEISCHGLSYEIVPHILIAGIGQFRPARSQGMDEFEYFNVNGLLIIHDKAGWRYAEAGSVPGRDEPRTQRQYHGPFATADDLARELVRKRASLGGLHLLELQAGARELAAALRAHSNEP